MSKTGLYIYHPQLTSKIIFTINNKLDRSSFYSEFLVFTEIVHKLKYVTIDHRHFCTYTIHFFIYKGPST